MIEEQPRFLFLFTEAQRIFINSLFICLKLRSIGREPTDYIKNSNPIGNSIAQ